MSVLWTVRVLVLTLLAAGGCSTTVPVAERTLAASPPTWVAVVPRTVRASPEFAQLVRTRKLQYSVEVVEYDAETGSPDQRLAVVRAALERVGSTTDGIAGYVLLVGGPATLPMGPWKFEGVEAPIYTDFPLGAELHPSAQPFPASEWRAALEREPRWLVGRIPYDEPALAVRVMSLSLQQMSDTTQPLNNVLLGAGGIGEAWFLASSRNELREQGCHAILVGRGGSCNAPAPAGVLPEWDRESPQLVVLAAQPVPKSSGDGLIGVLPGTSAREPVAGTPPALLTVFASDFGHPDNRVLRSLFDQGWTAGAVVFTAPVAAQPLTSAWRMSVLLPADLASGAPLGNSTEASRRRFWNQAGKDIGLIFGDAQKWRAHNALSVVVYGDPALRAARSSAPSGSSGQAPGLEIVKDSPAPTTEGTPLALVGAQESSEIPSGPLPASDTYAWYRFAGLAALLLFLVGVVLWLLVRKYDRTSNRR
jgi:hypothetical protein